MSTHASWNFSLFLRWQKVIFIASVCTPFSRSFNINLISKLLSWRPISPYFRLQWSAVPSDSQWVFLVAVLKIIVEKRYHSSNRIQYSWNPLRIIPPFRLFFAVFSMVEVWSSFCCYDKVNAPLPSYRAWRTVTLLYHFISDYSFQLCICLTDKFAIY